MVIAALSCGLLAALLLVAATGAAISDAPRVDAFAAAWGATLLAAGACAAARRAWIAESTAMRARMLCCRADGGAFSVCASPEGRGPAGADDAIAADPAWLTRDRLVLRERISGRWSWRPGRRWTIRRDAVDAQAWRRVSALVRWPARGRT